MKRCFPSLPKSGLTLIELLMALAIAVLLVGTVFLVYATALNTIRTQASWRENLEPAEDALDVLQRDILCSLIPRNITNLPFVLHPADAGQPDTLSLRMFTTRPGEGSNDWRTYGIQDVEYSVRAQNSTTSYTLVRQCHPFRTATGAADPAEETLLQSLAEMQILVYDGNEWTNAWETPAQIPQAARITFILQLPSGRRTLATETLIPAGHKIKAPTKVGSSVSSGK